MFDRSVRVVFDQAASAYDIARPGYPPELIDKLIELTQLPANARILEIGCGTGQITLPLAERGYEIVAIELGENLARIAASNLSTFPQIQVVHSSFEEWIADEPSFNLVLSAQAFHWIDPEIGYPKIRRSLKSGGHLAVVYNLFPGCVWPVYRDLDRVYQRAFPSREGNDAASLRASVERPVRSISDCGLFHEPVIWDHAWLETYTTDRYMKLLDTFSDHRTMNEASQKRLYEDVRTIIDKHGGSIDRPLLAMLFLAQVT
ncbi:class I SAM-dependent methyltransferase [Candidatus Bipolaricaulota bacterium]|nr:class I SAM-dependent methyltransferase [Candidatus Bipolaricaulota bacterium]